MADVPAVVDAAAPSSGERPGGAVRLYLRLVGAHVRSRLEYPASFALGVTTNLVLTGLEVVAILAVFSNVDRLAGWSVEEVVLLYGLGQTAFYVADVLVGHLDDLPVLVRTGALDVLLLRPRRVLFQVVAGDLDLRHVGSVIQGLTMLGVGLAVAPVAVGPGEAVARVVVGVVGGVVVYAAIWVATVSITFWLVDSREVSAAFTYGGRSMSMYPLGVYGDWLRRYARFVVPIAFTAYYPALGLLGRDDALGGSSVLAWAGPVVGAVALVVAGLVWRTGVRAYRSTGA